MRSLLQFCISLWWTWWWPLDWPKHVVYLILLWYKRILLCWHIFYVFNVLTGWQLFIPNCHKPFFPLLYNCQLLCFWPLALSTAVQVFPLPLFPNIAPSRMFTTNSLCLTVCPIHEWRLFFKIFKSNFSSFALWKTSPFVILSVHFIFNILLQHHVSNIFVILSSFFLRLHVSDP